MLGLTILSFVAVLSVVFSDFDAFEVDVSPLLRVSKTMQACLWLNDTGVPSLFLLTSKKRAWAAAKLFVLDAIALSLVKAERPRWVGFMAEGNASSTSWLGWRFHVFLMKSLFLVMVSWAAEGLTPACSIVNFARFTIVHSEWLIEKVRWTHIVKRPFEIDYWKKSMRRVLTALVPSIPPPLAGEGAGLSAILHIRV